MSYSSQRKGISGKTRTLSKKDSSKTLINPRTTMDTLWSFTEAYDVDAYGASPPKYFSESPVQEPTRMSTLSSAKDGAGYPIDLRVPEEAAIAVMGATGSGKSTFINLVSGSDLGIGRGLRSCTNVVQPGGTFDLDDRRVVLIDTPGFDDTTLSDTDILKMIAAFLETSYKRGTTLAGVLYFYRISDPRMGGIAAKNFRMFRKLCGNTALQNVVIVTNRWGEVDPQVGAAREEELKSDDLFFKPAIDEGARTARHENTVPSAEKIIRLILENQPRPLRIQEELVNEQKDISETSAGEELNREINAQIKKHREEMRALREEMKQAMRDKDEKTRREIEVESRKMRGEIARLENDSHRLESDYMKEKERLEVRLEQMEAERRQEVDRLIAQYQRQIEQLKRTLETGTAASEREKAEISKRISELIKMGILVQRPAGVFTKIGASVDKLMEKFTAV